MELFALILIILACVMFTSVLDQLIPHLSLPLIQIAAGLIVALIYPSLGGVNIDSELFLVLFIAPLLYRDSREVSRVTLWNNKWSILSMAIPLVIATVVATGFVLHQIIPSIQLAAAFACAAALGPTDAAAVSAMGSTIHLSERQSILLSGEALINDASGVVSFQFAIAAALTGARFETSKGRLMLKLLGWKRRVMDYDDEKKARVYFDTVVFALDLEYTAIRYLQGICREEDPERARLAGVLLEEHKAALQSLWGRINYGQEVKLEEVDVFVHTMGQSLPEGMLNRTMEQFRKAFAFNNEADANAMQIEMEKIRECRRDGSITEEQSWRLREEVYLMQTALLE